jgi:hypothetical protein
MALVSEEALMSAPRDLRNLERTTLRTENLARQEAEDAMKPMICFSGDHCINLGSITVNRVDLLYCAAGCRAKFYACSMSADTVVAV